MEVLRNAMYNDDHTCSNLRYPQLKDAPLSHVGLQNSNNNNNNNNNNNDNDNNDTIN